MVDKETLIKRNAIHGLESAIELSNSMVHLRKEHAKAILELLKEQEEIIKQYQKADGFLFAHGWKWEGR